MNNKLFVIYFISLFYLLNCLPSKDIWKKIINNKSNITLINDTNYFIFQESDYCKKDIYSEDMKKLYEKQKSFFSKWKTSNYIFVVDNLDEDLETIEEGAAHLSEYISNEFHVNMERSVLGLFSVQTRRMRIRTGDIARISITDKEAQALLYSLGDLLAQKNYYEAFLKLYDNLDFCMVLS